ncbi:hypothetical protein B566_EDAN001496 [Ephemera danica]|nr:hypothetical protein B566_EDAN001496 [Ephemera danica]
MTSNKENSDEVDEYLIPITKGGIPSRPMIPISAPSRPSKPSIPMLPRKKSFDSTNTSIQTPSMPPHFNKQRTPPPKPNKLEPSLGGGSLSRSHRGVPPPSDHHLPPPRGNQSVVGLPAEPWFHKMDRRQADMALKGKAENGCFMIRPSRTTNPYTLSLIYDGQSYHIGVRQRPDGQFALGSEKYNEQKFPSVEALVENYRREHLVLYSHGDRTGCTRLTVTPSRNPSNL